jgi:hypothetical protein
MAESMEPVISSAPEVNLHSDVWDGEDEGWTVAGEKEHAQRMEYLQRREKRRKNAKKLVMLFALNEATKELSHIMMIQKKDGTYELPHVPFVSNESDLNTIFHMIRGHHNFNIGNELEQTSYLRFATASVSYFDYLPSFYDGMPCSWITANTILSDRGVRFGSMLKNLMRNSRTIYNCPRMLVMWANNNTASHVEKEVVQVNESAPS